MAAMAEAPRAADRGFQRFCPPSRPPSAPGVAAPHFGRRLRRPSTPVVVLLEEEEEEGSRASSPAAASSESGGETPARGEDEQGQEESDSSSSSSSTESCSGCSSSWSSSDPGPGRCLADETPRRSSSLTQGVTGAAINRKAFRRGWRQGNVHDHFDWNEKDELGRGAFGRVFRGRSKYHSARPVAVKQLSRGYIDNLSSLWSEIAILGELDHPNVLRFLEAYEDLRHIYIVTEVCLGGPLSEWLERVQGSAAFAARVAHEVTGGLAHCHGHGICHRDLKLDNILLVRDSIDSSVRVADFGLARRSSKRVFEQRLKWAHARETIAGSTKCGTPKASAATKGILPPQIGRPSPKRGLPGSPKRPFFRRRRRLFRCARPRAACFTSCAGTPEYMAPEVMRVLNAQLSGQAAEVPFYDFRCDVWSLGVVVHVLLTGSPPYSLQQVSAFVAEGEPLLPPADELLHQQSAGAQSFVRQCLVADFAGRPSAEALLRHTWVAPDAVALLPTPTSAVDLARRLRGFAGLSHFKRAALLACVRHLGAYEHEQLRTLFRRVDIDNVGAVTVEELRGALHNAPPSPNGSLGRGWLDEVAKKLDSEGKGRIDYTEFLAAVMDHHIEDRPELAHAAFSSFDLNGDGVLSAAELAYVLEGGQVGAAGSFRGCQGWDAEAGGLSFEGFLALLRSG